MKKYVGLVLGLLATVAPAAAHDSTVAAPSVPQTATRSIASSSFGSESRMPAWLGDFHRRPPERVSVNLPRQLPLADRCDQVVHQYIGPVTNAHPRGSSCEPVLWEAGFVPTQLVAPSFEAQTVPSALHFLTDW